MNPTGAGTVRAGGRIVATVRCLTPPRRSAETSAVLPYARPPRATGHMQPSANRPGEPDPLGSTAERRLLRRARDGSRSAVDALFARYVPWLRNWARGRLPQRIRGAIDTSDIVQGTLHDTIARLTWFEPKYAGALRAYLRRAVDNRIRDELRRVARHHAVTVPQEPVRPFDDAAPQFRQLLSEDSRRRYLAGLKQLTARERRLIVGRGELGYNYKKLAFVTGLSSPDAARMALRRAMLRLSDMMPDE